MLTANADGYGVALDLADAGVQVQAVVDLRERGDNSAFARAVATRGISVYRGQAVRRTVPGAGRRHILGVEIAAVTGRGRAR